MADPEVLPKARRSLVTYLLEQVPSLADAITVARRLNALLRRKTLESLNAVMDAAARTPLKGFAAGLRRDIGAVQSVTNTYYTATTSRGSYNCLINGGSVMAMGMTNPPQCTRQ